MELHSPRPEHIQLGRDTQFTLKSSLSKSLLPGSPINNIQLNDKGIPNGTLLPPLPLEQRSMDGYMMVENNNNNNTNNNSSTSSLSSSQNGGFPSPPQSPIPFRESQNYKLVNLKQLDGPDTFVAEPVWDNQSNTSRYERSMKSFISQYRMFTKDPASSNNSVSSLEKNGYKYQLRMGLRKKPSPDDSSTATSITPFKKPTHRHHRTTTYKPKTIHRPALSSTHHTTPNIKWELLPDYSPSWDTLPIANRDKSLKVEWKGSIMDLSQDPLRDKLHPAELLLAQILRLPCSLYLDSKRRLFMSKVDRLRRGYPFRRTDAQKACHIDVNKASRLYSAFEKVGWLDDHLFTKYL